MLASCGKPNEGGNIQDNNFRKAILNQFSALMKDVNFRIDDRTDSIGKGFNSITGLAGERCLENEKSVFRFSPSARVDYEENLSSEQLLSKLGIGVNANIPISASGVPITLSPEMRYSKESGSTSLARTSNVTVEIIKGYNEITKVDPNSEYKLKDIHYKNLKAKSQNFFNACGDEIIVKQRVKALLLITAKFIFSDTKTKSEFEASMGASIPNPFNFGGKGSAKSSSTEKKSDDKQAKSKETTNDKNKNVAKETDKENSKEQKPSESKINTAINFVKDQLSSKGGSGGGMSPEIKVKFNNLSEEIRKNITIVIKATQLGGDPSRLPVLLSSSCTLSEPSTCDSLFTNIQQYASQDFPDQLGDIADYKDEASNNKFYLGDTEKSLYGNLTILNPSGDDVSSQVSSYTDGSIEFSAFKLKVRKDVRTSFQNYLSSQDIQNSKSFKLLANDEISVVKNTQEISENNLSGLFRFINNCYRDIKVCQSNYDSSRKLFYTEYNKEFDNVRAWTLIGSAQASWQPVRYILGIFSSDRITSDFFTSSNLRGYSSFVIKYLDKDRNKITSDKYNGISLSTSFRCYNWFSDALGYLWLHEVNPNIVIPITSNLANSCGSKTAFACTHNSDLAKLGAFNIEIWAE